MSAPRVPALVALLVESSAGLADVEVTQAYGYDAVAAAGRVFALVAEGGGIGVRLPDWDLFAAAYELPEAGRCMRTSSASATGSCCPARSPKTTRRCASGSATPTR